MLKAKTKFGILIEDLATMYDLQVDRRTATTSDRKARPKTQQNKEIIAAYIDAEAIPEGTGPRQALQLVEANIREKIKAGEPLHWLEQIHAGYMGHYLVLSKNKVLSKKIDFAISEGLSHEIFSTT